MRPYFPITHWNKAIYIFSTNCTNSAKLNHAQIVQHKNSVKFVEFVDKKQHYKTVNTYHHIKKRSSLEHIDYEKIVYYDCGNDRNSVDKGTEQSRS